MSLSRTRRFVRPTGTDDWASIASRELSDLAPDEAIGTLQSWNFHVFMRPAPPADLARAGNQMLPSDIIFIEAPLPAAAPASASNAAAQ